MKILVVAHDKAYVGGANRSLLMVLKGLRGEFGVECDVLLPSHGTMEQELKKEGFSCNVSSYKCPFSVARGDWLDIFRKLNVHLKYIKELYLGKRMAATLKNKQYDLVYTNTRYPVVGAQIAKTLNIPHVCHIREFGSNNNYQGMWTYSQMYKASNKIILISQALYDRMSQETPADKLVMIHNGISGDLGIERHEILQNGRFNILLTGRIVAEKGQKDAVLALQILHKWGYSNAHLYFAGSSPVSNTSYEEEIKAIVELADLKENVTFLGEVADMRKVRKNMDIELMCAVCETFGRVTVEGMRNGLLVIGSNTGGTVEIIQDKENGLLYEQGNPESLAKVLQKVLLNPKFGQEIADQGYKMSQTNFTEEKNVKEIYEVLKSVV